MSPDKSKQSNVNREKVSKAFEKKVYRKSVEIEKTKVVEQVAKAKSK